MTTIPSTAAQSVFLILEDNQELLLYLRNQRDYFQICVKTSRKWLLLLLEMSTDRPMHCLSPLVSSGFTHAVRLRQRCCEQQLTKKTEVEYWISGPALDPGSKRVYQPIISLSFEVSFISFSVIKGTRYYNAHMHTSHTLLTHPSTIARGFTFYGLVFQDQLWLKDIKRHITELNSS